MFKEAFLAGNSAVMTDLLELIEAHYLPQVTTSQTQIKIEKKKLEAIAIETDALEEHGRPKSDLTPDKKALYEDCLKRREEIQ